MEIKETFETFTVHPQPGYLSLIDGFKKLPLGEEMSVYFDYEPVEFYQMLKEQHEGQFKWTYVEKGPENWMAVILKTGREIVTVGDVFAENPKAYSVLRKYDIDPVIKGNILFSDACKNTGKLVGEIFQEIKNAQDPLDPIFRVSEWPLDFLMDYIVINHHKLAIKKTTYILNLLREAQNEEEQVNPLLFKINLIFININQMLKVHIEEQENVLFPAIKYLVKHNLPIRDLPQGTLKQAVSALQEGNRQVTSNLSKFRALNCFLENFAKSTPKIALLLQAIESFERELYFHLHLENNILFPKALFLEEEALIWD